MTCEFCGAIKSLQSHHIYTRHNRATRWRTINGVALCANHHTLSPRFSAHKTPIDFILWLERTRGKNEIQKLAIMAHGISKLHAFEKECILVLLTDEIKELTKQREALEGIYKGGPYVFKNLEI